MRVKRAALGVAFAAVAAVPLLAAPAQAGLTQCVATEFWNGVGPTVNCVPLAYQCVGNEVWNGIPATLGCL